MEEVTLSEVLFETQSHASGPCIPNYPPRQVNDTARSGVLSLLPTRGLTQLKEKWTAYRQPKKLKRFVSMFVSPKAERVAIAVGNHITILRKDEDYQQPYGTYTRDSIDAFTLGVWSEPHDMLGIVDDMDTFYFIKSNGEELIRIERRHLKVKLPVVGLFVPDATETRGSLMCNFKFLTSDGTLHHIEISQDLSACLSSIQLWSDIKRQFPLNFFCLDYSQEHSLLVLVGGHPNIPWTTNCNTGSCTLSVWSLSQNSDLLQVSSLQFRGIYRKPEDFRGLVVSPKVLFSPHGKLVATLDMKAHLNIFKLNVECSSLSPLPCGETNMDLLEDVADFSWWSDHICTIIKKGGATTMFDVMSGNKLLSDDPMYYMAVLERPKYFSGKLFILDISLPIERRSSVDHLELSYIHGPEQHTRGIVNPNEISSHSWRLLSFSERSVLEMYDVLVKSHSYESALDFADRYKLDKDQIFKSQWLYSGQGSDEVHMFLAKVKDEAFVLGECIGRVGRTEEALRALLAYGLSLTNGYKFSDSAYEICEDVWDFRLTRLQLLQFRDRLETFLGINMGRFSVQEYYKFRIMPINEAAVKLAENGKIGALNLLFKRHPFSLSPFILKILAAIPETIQVQTYSQLLPGRSPPSSTALREKDWVECEEMLNYIRNMPENDGRSVLIRTEPVIKQLSGILWPSADEILIWYKERAKEIDRYSGQLENSICLIDYGCRRGVYELQKFLDDILYLQQLVYSEGNDDEVHCPITLIEWEHLSDYEKFKTILKGVKEDNIVEILRVRAIPFMKSKRHLNGDHQKGDSFLVQWLKEIAAQSSIEFCSVVIDEWCRDVQSGFFADEMEAVDCALQCIYLCNAIDRWNTMASILSKFPNTRGSEIRLEGLEKRLKLAEGHIEAGRLLALYQVPKPVNIFLEAHNDDKAVKQILRLILSKFARRQPGRLDNDWASMWRDLQCLQEKAFPFIDLEYMLMEFCRGLLKAGRFSLARNYLKGTRTISLPTEKAESLVIQTAREFFFSASSLSSSEIWKARDCLDLFPNSPNVRLEADVIDALTIKLPNLGVNVLPMQYKQIKDPMEIVKMAITSQAGAYLNVDEIIEVAKLLGLGSQEDISAVQEAIAREAAVAGDLQLAFDLCLVLAKKGHGLVWDLCAAIARGPAIENMDLTSRKKLLGFALCHCDDESIGDLLHAWKDLDMQAQLESLTTHIGTPDFSDKGSSIFPTPGRATQSVLVGDLSEDEETFLSKIKAILSKVSKDLPLANGTTWDDFLRENGKVLSFADLQLPWLVKLSCVPELAEKLNPVSGPGKRYVPVRTQAVITILSWLARNGFAPRDDLISSLAKFIMEPPVTEEDDVVGCSFLLNLIDAPNGVEVIEQQLKAREDYQDICSIMKVGMIYILLQNSGAACKDPLQRRELLWRKFQEKISSDELDKVEKQSTFWRGWTLKLEEQKRTADRTKVLEELIPGVETARFLSGDLQYMHSVVMSFIESLKLQKKTILRDLLKLADTYSLNRGEVLSKFLACVLVSEAWSNEEIDAEISDFKGEILDSATKTIDIITSIVYPVVDGRNKTRLAYLFAQLSNCYLHLVEMHSSKTKDLADSFEKLGHFYQVLEHECLRVSFITDLNFKLIVDINIGNLNYNHFNDEVCRNVNEFTVEALAKLVKTLHNVIIIATREDIISWQDVYKHHVQTLLKNLEYRAKKICVENPQSLQSLLSELEQTYDACTKHISYLEHQSALVIMKQYFSGVVPLHIFRESVHSDPSLKDCLIVLLNFWMRLDADMVKIAESSGEKLSTVSLMICLKVFMRLVMEGKVTSSQGWSTLYYFANYGYPTSPVEDCSFCKAMVLSGCEFGSVTAVLSEALLECSMEQTVSSETMGGFSCSPVARSLYLKILEGILSNLVHDDSERQSLHNLLSSISKLGGDEEVLKSVRTAVWERIAKFSDDLSLPSHIRVYVLEVLQFILGRKGKVSTEQDCSVLPWEGWDDEWTSTSKNGELTLVALNTTELAGSISSHLEINDNDLLTVDSAVYCFAKLCEAADTHAHFDTLFAILKEWETLFLVEKTKDASAEVSGASDTGINWSDNWDGGWESFQDEDLVEEKKTETSVYIHPLHACWMGILRKLIILSRFREVTKLIDRSLERPDIVLIDEDDASDLSNMLIDSDCFMALKAMLLLPYEAIHLRSLNAVENKLKQDGIPEKSDKDFLILVLSSGIIFTIISKQTFGATFSYICYLVGNFSHQSQNGLVSRINQNFREDGDEDEDEELYCLTFRQILFPCFVSELVKANQQVLAGILVTKFMHTNPSLCLINVAEAGLIRYLLSHMQLLKRHRGSGFEARKPEILQQTLSKLEDKLMDLIQSALLMLPNS